MPYPSIKALQQIKDVTREDAKQIRAIMTGPKREYRPCGPGYGDAMFLNGLWQRPLTRLERIDLVLHTFGVEHIPAGHNSKSPAIDYCNAGDTYAATVLKVNGRFRVGCWGDLVERGKYD